MEFIVPKFIEREAKIVGPLTFKQLIIVGTAGALCIFFYFTLPLGAFIVLAIIILGIAVSLAFVKIQHTPLPVLIKNFIAFIFKPKIYLWKKRNIASKVIIKSSKIKKPNEIPSGKESPLKVGLRRGKLEQLFTTLETKK